MRTSVLLVLALGACSRVEYLADDPDGGTAADGSLDAQPVAGDAEPERDAADTITYDGGRVTCGKRVCQCSDGVDNDDSDMLADGLDPECTSAADDSEADFGTGARDQPDRNGCMDCFFDNNQGFNDGCRRNVSCFDSPQQNRPGNGGGACGCEVSDQCVDNCRPLVPNGCDCFGCCGVILGPQVVNVLLRSGCSMNTIDDEQKCVPCTPSSICNNPCGECEFCPGRTVLPGRCRGAVDCSGRTACPTNTECSGSEYCLQGCCFPIDLLAL